jgi:epoxyqueuosine reductase
MSDRTAHIIEKARDLGATMAGIASIESLKESPSHEILKEFGTEINGVAVLPGMEDFREIKWPSKTDSALIIAVSHPQDKPELDWSHEKAGTPGNRTLVRINRKLSEWIEETLGIKTYRMPYHVEMGGIYLKDAAILAGLGCIGRNNILITNVLGPRVRLRGMLLEAELTPTGPIDFDPCDGCEEYCRKACPQDAFEERAHSSVEIGIADLPGRDGSFSRARCMIQMGSDMADSGAEITEETINLAETETELHSNALIKWCRRCEFACPIGS